MTIHESELAIPEFENVPYKEARRIWNQFYRGNRDWFNVTILIGPLLAGLGAGLAAFCFKFESLMPGIIAGCLGGMLGYEIHRQIMIHHPLPKIREHLNQQPKT